MDITKASFERPLVEIADEACEKFGDRVCLQFGDEKVTYAELQQKSVAIAEALRAAGFERGQHAAIYSLNSAATFVVTLGIIRAGGVWLPVNPRNSMEDNVKTLNKLGCQVIFYQDAFQEVVGEIDQSETKLLLEQSMESLDQWLANAERVEVEVVDDPKAIVTMPTTGGTTGEPKAVMLSERNLRAISYAMAYNSELRREELGDESETVLLCAAPMTHVGGRIILTSLAIGCRCLIMDKVDPQGILKAIEKEKVTGFFLPPTAIYSLMAQPNVRDFDLSSLRTISYGSAPMSLVKLKEALETFGPVMAGGFGQTECPMMISMLPEKDHFVDGELAPDSRLQSVGRASVISELAILDDDANPLPVGELGEIGVKGDMVSEGYYNSPEETAKMRKNGWHLTGDIGKLDEEGYLSIIDRKKDMIITGGFNVYSTEVEQALVTIDGVDTAAVVGVPHEHWGEEVKAFVVRSSGTEVAAEDIIAACKAKIGSVKTPKSIQFVEDFPKTPIGKVDKKQLRQMAV